MLSCSFLRVFTCTLQHRHWRQRDSSRARGSRTRIRSPDTTKRARLARKRRQEADPPNVVDAEGEEVVEAGPGEVVVGERVEAEDVVEEALEVDKEEGSTSL